MGAIGAGDLPCNNWKLPTLIIIMTMVRIAIEGMRFEDGSWTLSDMVILQYIMNCDFVEEDA